MSEESKEVVSATVRLPKALHAKLSAIAKSEGKSLTDKVSQAVQEHTAKYERTSKTVTTYTQKKTAKK